MKRCLLMFGFLVLALLVAALSNESNQLNQEDTFDTSESNTELLLAKARNEE